MTVLTVGSFHDLIKIMTLISVLHVKVHVFPKTSTFIFSVETIYFFLKDRHVKRLCIQNTEYNPLFVQNTQIPYMLWISQIFIDFHGFSQFLNRFSWIPIDFHVFFRFSWISMDFYGFERFWKQTVGPPVAACATLWRPAAADWTLMILRSQILEAWIQSPGAWMPGC